MVFYFLTCLQCSMQVTLTFQKVIHFTDWVVGHAHLVMFGVFWMWFFGMMTYLFPRLLRPRMVQPQSVRMALLAVGGGHLIVMASDLTLAGLVPRLLLGVAAAVGRVGRLFRNRFGSCACSPVWRSSAGNSALSEPVEDLAAIAQGHIAAVGVPQYHVRRRLVGDLTSTSNRFSESNFHV